MDIANEELVQKIKNGEDGLIPILWDRVMASLRYFSSEYYRSHRGQCDRADVEEDQN